MRKKDAIIQTLLLRIEELELIVFGKSKKKKPEEKDEDNTDEPPDTKPKTPRDFDSYRRPIPKKEDITREDN